VKPAVVFEKVGRRFGQNEAVRDLSFSVSRGEMFGLIGPDGAGKTTTIRLLCGLLRPDSGSVRVLGLDPVREHRTVVGSVGYLSQRFSLYGDLSVEENIDFFAELHGLRQHQARRERLLEMTRLGSFRDRPAEHLSGGMKQKLALACTLVHQPQLIVLDEPTTGVDPVSRREFWKLLSEFLAEGITIVMSTPYLDEAERCSRVALLGGGSLMALDDPNRLRASLPGQVYEMSAAPQDLAMKVLSGMREVLGVHRFGDRLHVRLAAHGQEKPVFENLAAHGIRAGAARTVPASLEDVFIDLVTVAASSEWAVTPEGRPKC
jgi:ABC-2 type transport system ATP-binding protein